LAWSYKPFPTKLTAVDRRPNTEEDASNIRQKPYQDDFWTPDLEPRHKLRFSRAKLKRRMMFPDSECGNGVESGGAADPEGILLR